MFKQSLFIHRGIRYINYFVSQNEMMIIRNVDRKYNARAHICKNVNISTEFC